MHDRRRLQLEPCLAPLHGIMLDARDLLVVHPIPTAVSRTEQTFNQAIATRLNRRVVPRGNDSAALRTRHRRHVLVLNV